MRLLWTPLPPGCFDYPNNVDRRDVFNPHFRVVLIIPTLFRGRGSCGNDFGVLIDLNMSLNIFCPRVSMRFYLYRYTQYFEFSSIPSILPLRINIVCSHIVYSPFIYVFRYPNAIYIYWYFKSIMKISYISLHFVSIFLGIVSLSPHIYIADKITDLRILNKKNMSYGSNFIWCRPPFPNFNIFLWFPSSFVFFSKFIFFRLVAEGL